KGLPHGRRQSRNVLAEEVYVFSSAINRSAEAEAHARAVDGAGDAAGDGVTAVCDLCEEIDWPYQQRRRRLGADGASDSRSLDTLDDADVRNSRNLSACRTGAHGKKLEELAGIARAALDALCEQVGNYDRSAVAGARGVGDRNYR